MPKGRLFLALSSLPPPPLPCGRKHSARAQRAAPRTGPGERFPAGPHPRACPLLAQAKTPPHFRLPSPKKGKPRGVGVGGVMSRGVSPPPHSPWYRWRRVSGRSSALPSARPPAARPRRHVGRPPPEGAPPPEPRPPQVAPPRKRSGWSRRRRRRRGARHSHSAPACPRSLGRKVPPILRSAAGAAPFPGSASARRDWCKTGRGRCDSCNGGGVCKTSGRGSLWEAFPAPPHFSESRSLSRVEGLLVLSDHN